jgi:hypothetical protein
MGNGNIRRKRKEKEKNTKQKQKPIQNETKKRCICDNAKVHSN